MTATPHDAFFKAAFEHPEHAGQMVHRLLPEVATKAITWTSAELVNTSFVDPELEQLHSDLLFSAQLNGAPAYIYFLFEHQSTTDYDMPFRVLGYLMRIWTRHRAKQPKPPRKPRRRPLPVIVAIVISNATGGWDGPLSFHDLCHPHPSQLPGIGHLLPDFSLLLVDLSKTSNEELNAWALEAFPKAALFALRDARDPAKLLQDFDHWGALLGEAAEAPLGMDAIRQLIQYIAQASPNLNIEDFRAKIRQYLPKAETELMTIYEQARQAGLQQGIGQGIEQGIHRGRIEQLLELLELKFGELPSEYAARLQSATPTDIHRYAKRILTVDSLEAVFADLA